MEQFDLLRFLCTHLDRIGVRYFVTGSQATIAYGEPRFTNDIDIVVELNEATCDAFCEGFPADEFYLNRSTAREEIARRGMFNIIHPGSGLKIDVIIPTDSSFDRQRFERAVRIPLVEGWAAMFSSPEDIILQKMSWHKLGGGDRHIRDIAGVLKVRGGAVDRAYIAQQASELGVEDVWSKIEEDIGGRD